MNYYGYLEGVNGVKTGFTNGAGRCLVTSVNRDGFEIITSWFPGFLLRNNVSLSLLARNATEEGISATKVREYIVNDDIKLKNVVPNSVYCNRESIKQLIYLSKLHK